ncbi:MAG TPA: TlpA disulfide reductase family protein [Phycisphaerae bacterium]|nr:TlpA disulfide reductase family protein [Phycisphaerae bacterium]
MFSTSSCLLWALMLPAAPQDLPTAETIRAAARKGFGQLRSLQVEYHYYWPLPTTQSIVPRPPSRRALLYTPDQMLVISADALTWGSRLGLYTTEQIYVGPDECAVLSDVPWAGGVYRQHLIYRHEVDHGTLILGDPRMWGLCVAFQRFDRWLAEVDFIVTDYEQVGGVRCVKIIATQPMPVPKGWRQPQPTVHYRLWLDPDRGFFPRQIEHGTNPSRPAVRLVVDRFVQAGSTWIPAEGRYIADPAGAAIERGKLVLIPESLAVDKELFPQQFSHVPVPGATVEDHRGIGVLRYEQPYPKDDQEFINAVAEADKKVGELAADATTKQITQAVSGWMGDPNFADIALPTGRVQRGYLMFRVGQRLLKQATEDEQVVAAAQQVAQAAVNLHSLWPDASLLEQALAIVRSARQRSSANRAVAALLSTELNLKAAMVLRETHSRWRAAWSIFTEVHGLTELYPDGEPLAMTVLSVASDLRPRNRRESDYLLKLLKEQCAGTRAGRIATGMLHVESEIGAPLNMRFTAIDGRKVDLATLRGSVVLLHYMSTAAPETAAAVPLLLQMYRHLQPVGLEVVLISLDTDVKRLAKYVEELQVPWPVYCDTKAWESPLVYGLGVRDVPTTFLIDRQSRLRHAWTPPVPERILADLLMEPAEVPTTTQAAPPATAPASQPASSHPTIP